MVSSKYRAQALKYLLAIKTKLYHVYGIFRSGCVWCQSHCRMPENGNQEMLTFVRFNGGNVRSNPVWDSSCVHHVCISLSLIADRWWYHLYKYLCPGTEYYHPSVGSQRATHPGPVTMCVLMGIAGIVVILCHLLGCFNQLQSISLGAYGWGLDMSHISCDLYLSLMIALGTH